jgi:hypothetical protein
VDLGLLNTAGRLRRAPGRSPAVGDCRPRSMSLPRFVNIATVASHRHWCFSPDAAYRVDSGALTCPIMAIGSPSRMGGVANT